MDLFDLQAILSLSTKEFESGINKARGIAETDGSAIGNGIAKGLAFAGKATIAAVGAIGVGLTKLGKDSIATGMEFDEAMSQVAATTGVTMEQFNNTKVAVDGFNGTLREFALEQGAKTVFSATECAEALNYMALAGYDAQTQAEMLTPLLNLAAAGNMDLAYASDMVTDTQSALCLSLEQTNTMVDQMAKGASTTNTSVAQLGEAMLQVGGTAKNMKGGTEEIIQVLGILADSGIKGAEAGTHLRNMILSLSSPTSDAAAAMMEKLNIQLYDAHGNMRDLEDVFNEMRQAMSSMTSEEKTNAINDIFNKTDISAVNALLNTNSERWQEVETALEGAKGAAQQMADTQLDNLSGDVTLLGSAFESLKIGISDSLTPAFRDYVQLAITGLNSITEGINNGGLGGALDGIDTFINNLVSKLSEDLPKVLGAATSIFGSLVNALASNLPTLINGIVPLLPPLIESIINAAGTLLSNASEIIMPVVRAIPTILMALAEAVRDNAPIFIEGAVGLITELANELPTLIPMLTDATIILIEAYANAMPQIIQAYIDGGIIPALISCIPAILQAVGLIAKAILIALPQIFFSIVEQIPTIVGQIITAIIDNIPQFSDAVMQIVMAMIAVSAPIAFLILDNILPLLPKVIEFVNNLWGNIKSWWSDFTSSVQSAVVSIVDSVIEWIRDLPSRINDKIQEIKAFCVYFFKQYPVLLGEFLGTLLSNIIKFGLDVWNTITVDIPRILTQVYTFVSELPLKIGEYLLTTLENIVSWLKDILSTIIKEVPKIVNKFVSFFEKIPSKVKTIGKNIIEGLWNGINGAKGWLEQKISDFASGVIQGFKDSFKISSPSKVMRDEVGKFIAEGVGVGMEENAPIDAVDSMFNDIMDASAGFNFGELMGSVSTADSSAPIPALAGGAQMPVINLTAPIYLGNELLDTAVIKAINTANYRSGGR